MGACVVKAVGEDAVELATELEKAATAVQSFYRLMVKRGQNKPNAAAVGQVFNGMLSMNINGECRIVPHMLHQYVRRN
jgi:hypothetical protein